MRSPTQASLRLSFMLASALAQAAEIIEASTDVLSKKNTSVTPTLTSLSTQAW